ncbi:MAG TPA: PDZ domain-containing protein [Clostridiales bacterium]|nr:PDZ domain-containing protein [Clostridiales bacterium]
MYNPYEPYRKPEDSQDSARGSFDRESGEYHYVRPESANRHYSDASYTPAESSPVRRYYYTPPEKRDRSKKGKEGRLTARIIALCLICALFGGVAGAFAGNMDLPFWEKDSGSAVTEPPESNVSPNVNSPNQSIQMPSLATPIVTGDVMSPTEIYTLACSQTVGITTEITRTNTFGITSSTSVTGSGFIFSGDGYIITNYHVIEEAHKGGYDIFVMLYTGDTYPATIVGSEPDNDVAVLKIEAEGLNAVAVGDSDKMQVGEWIYAVGNPLGELAYTMTFGMVSALDREISTEERTTINMFQIDAAVNSGNSGGPIYNSMGQVIGIVTAKYSSAGVEGLGFAIPINDAVGIAKELIEKGYVSGKAYMGITVTTVPSSVAQYYNMVEGAFVYALDGDSCAARAGLKVGDIITEVDGREIKSASDLVAAKKNYRAGDTATLKVYRSGEYLELSITFDEELPGTKSEVTPESSFPRFP